MNPALNRRDFLLRTGGGFGGLALAQMLGSEAMANTLSGSLHHPPKAKRVIQLFMNGGVSQMDTFDPKPRLDALHDQAFDPGAGQLVESVTNSPGFCAVPSNFSSTASAGAGSAASSPTWRASSTIWHS
jgi:hypothetical protein